MTVEMIFDKERNTRRHASAAATAIICMVVVAVGIAAVAVGMPGMAVWVIFTVLAGLVLPMALIVMHNAPGYEVRPSLTHIRP